MMQQPEEQKKKKGLFSQKAPEVDYSGLSKDISMIGRRMRVLEDRSANLNRKTQVTEQNMINNHKKLALDIKTIMSDLNDLKRELADTRNIQHQVIEELRTTAKKEEVKMLEKYVNLWETVNFVTRKQVENIVRDILEEQNKEENS